MYIFIHLFFHVIWVYIHVDMNTWVTGLLGIHPQTARKGQRSRVERETEGPPEPETWEEGARPLLSAFRNPELG